MAVGDGAFRGVVVGEGELVITTVVVVVPGFTVAVVEAAGRVDVEDEVVQNGLKNPKHELPKPGLNAIQFREESNVAHARMCTTPLITGTRFRAGLPSSIQEALGYRPRFFSIENPCLLVMR